MKILTNTGGIASTNSYLVADEATGKAVIFDAPDHTVAPLLGQAKKNNWDIIGLWLTHGHFDHVADHAVVTTQFPKAQVLLHRLDEVMLLRPDISKSIFQLPFTIPPRGADAYLNDGQELRLGDLKVMAIHTPGHSPGHVMFHFPEQGVLIGGDLIICGGVGRTDLPGSDPALLNPSIRRVMQLPPATRLLPGHCEPSTLGEELAGNQYVRMAIEERQG
jgi:hydroxyacylglutathione hydrolase